MAQNFYSDVVVTGNHNVTETATAKILSVTTDATVSGNIAMNGTSKVFDFRGNQVKQAVVENGATLPSTGSLGQLFYLTTGAPGLYVCTVGGATPTWTILKDGYLQTLPTHASTHISTGSDKIYINQLSVNGDVNMSSNKITNIATPVSDSDAATKGYVDAARAGLSIKDPVFVATDVALVGTYASQKFTVTSPNSPTTIDDVSTAVGTMPVGTRILLKNQTPAWHNGIYEVETVPTTGVSMVLKRTSDANTSAEMCPGATVWVNAGTVNGDSRYVCTNDKVILDNATDGLLVFTQDFKAANLNAGAGISKSGNKIYADVSSPKSGLRLMSTAGVTITNGTLDANDGGVIGIQLNSVAKPGLAIEETVGTGGLYVKVDGTSIGINATSGALELCTGMKQKIYSADVPATAGGGTAVMAHGLGGIPTIVQVILKSTGQVVYPEILFDANNISLKFGTTAVTASTYTVNAIKGGI